MYYYTKTSLRVAPHLELIYGSWDPRFPDPLIDTAGLLQLSLCLVRHAALPLQSHATVPRLLISVHPLLQYLEEHLNL
jgi:hypothetical protein